ncbi:MAG: replication-associated recombination protein A [Deltaproteobacteria bacterium]|nr:replication-associated recombination protein A [Deltaproteobacteria bacterium]
MDLFKHNTSHLKPLADQIRPQTLDAFAGQRHILGPGKILTELLKSGAFPSLIFWGPPGVGKTTLAKIIAGQTRHRFITQSAVTSGIKEVKEIISEAKDQLGLYSKKTILFIDEIHRFNKAQQDAFLPHVEDGTIILFGATTENPSFEVIPALLSRCKVILLNPLSHEELKQIINRALEIKNRADLLDDEGKNCIVNSSYGDARYLLNILEDLLTIHRDSAAVTAKEIREKITTRAHLYDKKSEHHYNVISAFIKSMRGSDPNAALYYLARMLEAGEDPLFVARRMVIFASEDVGLANPTAVQVAVSCMQSYDFVGPAEGWIPLAHCAVYLAGSPKSNSSYAGYKKALADVEAFGPLDVPLHLRNAPTQLMKDLDYGKGYKYAHNFEGNKIAQQHLPDKIKDHVYYHPTDNGHEKKIREWLHIDSGKS